MASEIILPKGVGLICDGNRRWADSQGLPHERGHQKGFEAVKEILKETRDLGIRKLIAWGLSTDNQKRRSQRERMHLYSIFENAIEEHLKDALENETRLVHIGREDRLPKSLIAKMRDAVEKTSGYDKYTFAIALDYGGRDEITSGMHNFAKTVLKNPSLLKNFDETEASKYLQTGFIADDIDLIIRTGGDSRSSGFLPWVDKAELVVVDEYLPDFSREQYRRICTEVFPARPRRMGA